VAPQAYLNALPDGLRWPDLVQGIRGAPNSYPDLVWMSQVHFDENQNLKKSVKQIQRQSTLSNKKRLPNLRLRKIRRQTQRSKNQTKKGLP
jgi:hypothetical protein